MGFRVSGLRVLLLCVCSGFRLTNAPGKRGFVFKISYLHLSQGHKVTLGNLRLEKWVPSGPSVWPKRSPYEALQA